MGVNTMRHALMWPSAIMIGLATTLGAACAQGQKVGAPPEAVNMKLLGMNDLQGRSAYQPTIHKQGNRYIAYIGHHGGTEGDPKPLNPLTGQKEFNGTSVVDVTDPAKPVYLVHIPGEEGLDESGGGQMTRVCDGGTLPKGDPSAVYLLRTFGNSAHEVWNVADPAKPALVTRITGIKGTHKNWWECDTGVAYLVSGIEGWRTRRMTQIYDLSDPAHPRKIRDYGLPGQEPGSTGPMSTELHGPISLGPDSNRIYFGYGTNKDGLLQIVDRKKLIEGAAEPTAENLRAPEVSRLYLSAFNGAHTTYPLPRMPIAEFAKGKQETLRDFVMIVDESLVNECAEPRQMVWFADVTVENRPLIVSSYTVKESSGQFCDRGGRFGSHSSNESFAPIYLKKLAFIAFFNAGVRAVDIRDPYHPTEVASFIPAITDRTTKRCVKVDGQDRCKVAIQTNNVETDDRGYIYIVDRANTGLHILDLTADAKAIAH
jgi:hypothetical protein